MDSAPYQPLVHRFAVATAAMALVPIVVGAIVTTLDAGMAFRDWPSSDGHGMLAYPWLESAGHKFVEHGHRLAGMAIGLMSIAFVIIALIREPRLWVKGLAVAVLLSVIAQGLLGGQRVLSDARQLAMLHGSLAALVFALMGSVSLITSRAWLWPPVEPAATEVSWLKPLALMTPVVVFSQYLLGGALRHFGRALYEHAGIALIVLSLVVATAVAAKRSGVTWLRRSGRVMLVVVLVQASLGIAAWITKFGLATLGYVAVQHSPLQLVVRTSHTVVGMMLFMTSVLFALQVHRVSTWQRQPVAGTNPFQAAITEGGVR